MIHLITFNPEIRTTVVTETFEVAKNNYSSSSNTRYYCNASNISDILSLFKLKSSVVSLKDDKYSYFIEQEFKDKHNYLIDVNDLNSSIIIENENTSSVINNTVDNVSEKVWNSILKYVKKHVKTDDYVVLCGGESENILWDQFIKLCLNIKEVTKYLYIDKIFLDECHLEVVKPYFIRYNKFDLEKYNGYETDFDKLDKQVKNVIKYSSNVMISLGKNGLYYNNGFKSVKTLPLIGNVNCLEYAGDNVIAAAIYCNINGRNLEESARFCAACGSVSVYSGEHPTLELIDQYYSKINVSS